MDKYKSLSCGVCHNNFSKDDDIVVCPDCGAPHHRECWQSINHCVYEENHGTDQEFSITNEVEDESKLLNEDIVERRSLKEMQEELIKQKILQESQNPFFTKNNINQNEDIDGVTAKEIAQFVGYNALRYIYIFKRMATANIKIIWNWLAFLIPTAWFFSRKLYIQGVVFASFDLLLSIIYTLSFNSLNNDYGIGTTQNYTQEQILSISQTQEFLAMSLVAFSILFIRIISGLFANYFYKQKAYKEIKFIRTLNTDKEMSFAKLGGVTLFIPALALALINIIGSTLLQFFS